MVGSVGRLGGGGGHVLAAGTGSLLTAANDPGVAACFHDLRPCGPAAAAILSTRHPFTSRQPGRYTQAAPLLHPASDQGAAFVSELQAAQRLALSTLLYKLVPFLSTLYLKKNKQIKITNTAKRISCLFPTF